jgi:hypothetical protein
MKYGLVVFKKGMVIDDDIQIEKCSQIRTQMNGWSVFLVPICGSKLQGSRHSKDFYST